MSCVLVTIFTLIACADPANVEDAPVDAGRDASVAGDAGGAVSPDAGGDGRDAGTVSCAPNGRRHFMLGSAQNPQTVLFGEGLAHERRLEIDGAYLAAFDSGGCFEWLALMPAQQGSFGGTNMIVDEAGNIYFSIALNGEIEFRNADDSVALTITATGSTARETFRRGIAVVSYDREGRLRWVRRMGNALEEPADKGYTAASLQLSGRRLRVTGTANGSTRGPADDYEMAFGLGESNETRVTIGQRFQFGYVAVVSPDTGDLVADSVRITAPLVGATNFAARHNGRGAGREAEDGSYVLGQLYVGNAGDYVLNRGRVDEFLISVSSNFVASFAQYDGTGALAWHRFAGAASGGMSVFSSETLADGSVLFSGGAADRADFAQSAGSVLLAAGSTAYLVRYGASGDVTWLRGIGGRGLSRMLVDETRGAIFALGDGEGEVVFGVSDPDSVTETIMGPYLARFELSTGALVWVSKVDAETGSFRDMDLIDDVLVVSTRFDNEATFAPGTTAEETVRITPQIWSGNASYAADDGAFRGLIEYVRHRGTPRNDGLNVGGVYRPNDGD